MKFLFSEFACCFYKSTARPCMGYCLHDQVGAPSYSLNIWDELQTRECRTVNHSFETLPHCLNVATLSLFCRYCFGRCSSELAELFLLPYLSGRFARYSNRLHDFSVTILGCFNDVSVSSFFPCTARLWNSLPAECFPWTYYRNGFKRGNAQVFIFCWLLLLYLKINAAIVEVIKTKIIFLRNSLGRKIFHILLIEIMLLTNRGFTLEM